MAAQAVAPVRLCSRCLVCEGQQTVDRRSAAGRQVGATVNGARVIGTMTLLAQPGRARLQQCRVVRTMGRMAVSAVFRHRAVLPEERTAPLGVTRVASL